MGKTISAPTEKGKTMLIEYKGYVVSQSSYNHHVMIAKGEHVVYHASCTKRMSKNELRKMVDWYIDFITNRFDAIYNDDSEE